MDSIPGGAERAERPGSLIEGLVVGLALEVGVASALALAASQVRPWAWSPFGPIALLLISAFAFAMVASLCLGPGERPLALLGGWIARRRRSA
jgi:hypothetical protein